jgi:arsenical pump membrane protein
MLVALVSAAALLLILLRPRGWPVWIWAAAGAAVLVIAGATPIAQALAAIRSGTDVYCFLVGMMLLAELLRAEGVFDWIADGVLGAAGGSALRFFAFVFGVGIVLTAFLSNDATAVGLTPAIAAAVRRVKIDALPALFACALVANAASFVLPISNPANLVVFSEHPPALGPWLHAFALPSLAAIAITFASCVAVWRVSLRARFTVEHAEAERLSGPAQAVGVFAILAAIAIVTASFLNASLGLTTLICGLVGTIVQAIAGRRVRPDVFANVDWGIVPFVAGLFVIVSALYDIGVLHAARHALEEASRAGSPLALALAALAVALACAVANNLPVGLIAGAALNGSAVTPPIHHAVLIAVDLGPNLALSGSLATYLWLTAIRREGFEVSAWQFARYGAVLTIPALLGAVLATLVQL